MSTITGGDNTNLKKSNKKYKPREIKEGRAILVTLSSDCFGSVIPINRKRVFIGRDPDCDGVLLDNLVSKNHIKIEYDNNDYSIEDLNSTNGTELNGRILKKSKHLNSSDRIKVGKTILIFLIEEE